MANDVMTRQGIKNSEDIVCYDGIVYILCHKDSDYSLFVEYIGGEYSTPLSLKDIEKKYPNVFKVIIDKALEGEVYNYRNHRNCKWEWNGRTDGYA